MAKLLEVKNLVKSFGGVKAVNNISFDLFEGQILAMIGPNGAGKSTCFNLINGQLMPDRGSIRVDGREVIGLKPRQIWKLGIGRTFQITSTFVSMTVLENVQMALMSHHRKTKSLFQKAGNLFVDESMELLNLLGLAQQHDRLCGVIAYGDLKRVELAMALSHRPRLLLMDEPTAGMGPAERLSLMKLTSRIVRTRNLGVLFTEHDMDVVFSHADRVMVLNRGELILEGLPQKVRENKDVQLIYLGNGGA